MANLGRLKIMEHLLGELVPASVWDQLELTLTRAAFPSGCLAAQTKRWAEGIGVPAPLALVPLRWGCALPSPNAPGKAPNHIHMLGEYLLLLLLLSHFSRVRLCATP